MDDVLKFIRVFRDIDFNESFERIINQNYEEDVEIQVESLKNQLDKCVDFIKNKFEHEVLI